MYDELGLFTDDKSHGLLDSLSSACTENWKKRSHLFAVQHSVFGEDYLVVYESTSATGDFGLRVSSAIRRTYNPDGSVYDVLLGRSLFVRFPSEGHEEITGPFSEEVDLKEVIDEVMENAMDTYTEISSVTKTVTEVFAVSNVKVRITDLLSPSGLEMKQVSLTAFKVFPNELERDYVELMLRGGCVCLIPLDSTIENRGGAAFIIAGAHSRSIAAQAQRSFNGSIPLLPQQPQQQQKPATPAGFRLLPNSPYPYCTTALTFVKEPQPVDHPSVPSIRLIEYGEVMRQNRLVG